MGWRILHGKKCLEFKNSCYINFGTSKDAFDYISRKLELLNDWITKDIPEQSKNWGDRKNDFMNESEQKYKEIRDAIHNLKVKTV